MGEEISEMSHITADLRPLFTTRHIHIQTAARWSALYAVDVRLRVLNAVDVIHLLFFPLRKEVERMVLKWLR